MNDFEKHILKNRHTLDHIERPDADKVWRQLRQDLGHESKVRRLSGRQLLRIAAAAVLLLAIGVVIGLNLQSSSENQSVSLADIAPALAQQTVQYQQLIANKMDAMNYDAIDRRNFRDIFDELQKLDDLHEQLLQDIPAYGENPQLAKAILKYYELKIKILERLEYELNKQQYHEKRIQESI